VLTVVLNTKNITLKESTVLITVALRLGETDRGICNEEKTLGTQYRYQENDLYLWLG